MRGIVNMYAISLPSTTADVHQWFCVFSGGKSIFFFFKTTKNNMVNIWDFYLCIDPVVGLSIERLIAVSRGL